MLHGTGLNGLCWTPVASELASRGYRPLAVDLRGHGRSGHAPTGLYPWDDFAADALDVVDQLGLDRDGRLVGVGHSAGASALLLAEASRPGTFGRIWVWEPIMRSPANNLTEPRARELAEGARRRRARFDSMEDAKAHLEGRGVFADFSAEALQGFLSGALVDVPDGDLELACAPEDEARTFEAGPVHDAWDRLPLVRCPTKVLGGEHSPAVPPSVVAAIAARCPAGESAVVASAGHVGPFQFPSAIAADIADWAARPDQVVHEQPVA
jgi:pimeloyl-ACP methyl ester carboxylesterase